MLRMRAFHTCILTIILAAVLLQAQTYRYLRFTTLECSGEKYQEIDWFEDGVAHPDPHLTSVNSNGMLVWGDNAGWEIMRPYDGDPATHCWLGDVAPPYTHEIYLDLGEGNGILPDSIGITKPGYTSVNHFQCWASTDAVGWDLFLDTVLSDPTFNQRTFPLALVADTEDPTAPANLAASNITGSSLVLTWTAATDNRFVHEYHVYQDAAQVGTANGDETSYRVADLTPATSYEFYVVAADRAGNTSPQSNTVTTTTSDADATPPEAPTAVTATPSSESRIDVTWTASSSGSDVVGYIVYLDGNPVGCSEGTSYPIVGLDPATQYSVTVRAKDGAGNASDPSSASQATTAAAGAPQMLLSTNFWNPSWGGGSADPFRDGVEAVSGDNPWKWDLLNELYPYHTLRFMDWGGTNGSDLDTWMDRTQKTDLIQKPVAYEWMIDICNRLDANMWVCIPHPVVSRDGVEGGANSFIRKLGILVKTGVDMRGLDLDQAAFADLATMTRRELIAAGGVAVCAPLEPELQLYVEYSNETWNFAPGFDQSRYCVDEGVALNLGTGDEYYQGRRFHAWAAIHVFEGMEDVFGAGNPRLVRIDAYHAGGSIHINNHLQMYDNPTYNSRGIYPDAFSPAPYFGHNIDGSSGTVVSELYDHIVTRAQAVRSDRTYVDSAAANRSVDFDLIAYEGGQHVTTNADVINRDAEMYNLYIAYLDSMSGYFEEFAHYAHSGSFGSGGAWGAKETIGQDIALAHKYRALVEWSEATNPLPFDPSPPSIPANLAATDIYSTQLTLTWDAAADAYSGVEGYLVYQNGYYIGFAPAPGYTITGLSPTTSYAFSVKAQDLAGNISQMSDTLTATTNALSAALFNRRQAGRTMLQLVPARHTIEITNAAGIRMVELFDMAGRRVLARSALKQQRVAIGIDRLRRASYLVRVYDRDGRVWMQRVTLL